MAALLAPDGGGPRVRAEGIGRVGLPVAAAAAAVLGRREEDWRSGMVGGGSADGIEKKGGAERGLGGRRRQSRGDGGWVWDVGSSGCGRFRSCRSVGADSLSSHWLRHQQTILAFFSPE